MSDQTNTATQVDPLEQALEAQEQAREAKACAVTQVQLQLPNGNTVFASARRRLPTPEGKRGKYYEWEVSAGGGDGDLVLLGTWEATVGQAQFRVETLAKWDTN